MIPLSILDLSPVSAGSTAAQALRNSLDLARLADDLGFTRYWVAEHHNLPAIASSAPDIMEMKIAAARALAELAREDVPDEVASAYGARPKYGPDYIIPVPFDPRLISYVPPAVAKAAMDTGVARKPIVDMDAYRHQLSARRDPIAGTLVQVFNRLRRQPRRVVFAEGEEEQVIRAAASFVHQGLGTALLVGREDRVRQSASESGIELGEGIEIVNARVSTRNTAYMNFLYERLQRRGYLMRDCQRLVNQDRNHFAACMVALGDADAMVTGVTRNFSVALEDVRHVIDPKPGHRVIGVSVVVARGRTVLVADTAVTEMPEAHARPGTSLCRA